MADVIVRRREEEGRLAPVWVCATLVGRAGGIGHDAAVSVAEDDVAVALDVLQQVGWDA